jgi:hypothetical protein
MASTALVGNRHKDRSESPDNRHRLDMTSMFAYAGNFLNQFLLVWPVCHGAATVLPAGCNASSRAAHTGKLP